MYLCVCMSGPVCACLCVCLCACVCTRVCMCVRRQKQKLCVRSRRVSPLLRRVGPALPSTAHGECSAFGGWAVAAPENLRLHRVMNRHHLRLSRVPFQRPHLGSDLARVPPRPCPPHGWSLHVTVSSHVPCGRVLRWLYLPCGCVLLCLPVAMSPAMAVSPVAMAVTGRSLSASQESCFEYRVRPMESEVSSGDGLRVPGPCTCCWAMGGPG